MLKGEWSSAYALPINALTPSGRLRTVANSCTSGGTFAAMLALTHSAAPEPRLSRTQRAARTLCAKTSICSVICTRGSTSPLGRTSTST